MTAIVRSPPSWPARVPPRPRPPNAAPRPQPSYACPACGHMVRRAARSFGDRLIGALTRMPLHRYRCSHLCCGWTALLRQVAARPPDPPR